MVEFEKSSRVHSLYRSRVMKRRVQVALHLSESRSNCLQGQDGQVGRMLHEKTQSITPRRPVRVEVGSERQRVPTTRPLPKSEQGSDRCEVCDEEQRLSGLKVLLLSEHCYMSFGCSEEFNWQHVSSQRIQVRVSRYGIEKESAPDKNKRRRSPS
jgi:hypothetical protein